jgi:endoglucanase
MSARSFGVGRFLFTVTIYDWLRLYFQTMNTLMLLALLSTNGVQVSWTSAPGIYYVVAGAPALRSPMTWATVTNVEGNGKRISVNLSPTNSEQYFQVSIGTNPWLQKTLYVETDTPASRQIASLPSDSVNRALLSKIADQPTSVWVNSPSSISRIGQTFSKCGTAVPTFVLYHIYQRDNTGNFSSSGGATSPGAYTNYINSCRTGLLGKKDCIVILEPDSIAGLGELSVGDQEIRYKLLTYAVDQLAPLPNVRLYLDGGHSKWKSEAEMATRLRRVGIAKVRGFALNVANYRQTGELIPYGTNLLKLLDNTHFVIDTSRNGGPYFTPGSWCNLQGAGLGEAPTLNTGVPFLDAKLYIKYPGESDGPCNGGPNAGTWWLENAIMLCTNARQ